MTAKNHNKDPLAELDVEIWRNGVKHCVVDFHNAGITLITLKFGFPTEKWEIKKMEVKKNESCKMARG